MFALIGLVVVVVVIGRRLLIVGLRSPVFGRRSSVGMPIANHVDNLNEQHATNSHQKGRAIETMPARTPRDLAH